MIPDAILSAFIEAKGAREATRAIQGVQNQFKECKREADLATAAVNRFGRTRGIAVLDVNAAKAQAQIAQAAKGVDEYGKAKAAATLDANGARAKAATAIATREVQEFGRVKATAVLDADASRVSAMGAQVRKSSREVEGLSGTFDGLRASKGQTDKLIDKNVGTFGRLAQAIRGTSSSAAQMRGSLGPLSGGLGVVASAALALAVALLAIGGPAAAVLAALGPLVGIAAGLGGALVAAAQGFGVFKLATSGVGDALKEQVKASAGAGQAALQQAGQEVAASRAIRGAQEAVADAQRRVRETVDALGPAYQEARARLADMKAAVTGTSLSLREARFAAKDAQTALSELLAGPSPRVLADAHRAVADALRGERSAAEGLADAHRALNDLIAPPSILDLADARDAAADATRGEAVAARDLAKQIAATNAILGDPGSSEGDKADARLALAAAENAVGDAARQTARSQAALAKLEGGPAQDEVARARGRVKDAEAAVAAAKRDTLDAQAALAKAESPASSDAIARARLALAQAQHGLAGATRDAARAARDYGAAEAAGIARAPEVLAAREAVRAASVAATRAERSLSEAQADAAQSALVAAGAATNLSEKFDKLPAPAQAFVRQLQAMKPRLDELRATAAGGFFPGASAGLIAASGSFREINSVVRETSGVLGEAARKSGELVGSPAFGKDIQTIGSNNAKVIGTLAEALRHVISAFRHVLVAAGPLTQWLADVANKWALNAAEAAKAGRETGKLAEFFEKTKAVAQRLGSILGNLGSAFLGIGKAGTSSGNEVLASLDRLTERFAEWANSVKGSKATQEFFEDTRRLAEGVLPVLAGLVSGAVEFITELSPLAALLREVAPLADEVAFAFLAWKAAMTGMKIVAFITSIGGLTGAFWTLNAAMAANPIGLIVVGIAALVAAFIYAYNNSEDFRHIVDGALRAVADAFEWMWNAAKNVFGWLSDNWGTIKDVLTNPIGAAITVIREFGSKMLDAAKWLLDQFKAGVMVGVEMVKGVGGWIVNRVAEGAKGVAGFGADVGGWVKNRVVEDVQTRGEAFKAAGGWITNRIAEGAKIVTEALLSVGGWLKNRIVELVHLAVEGFKDLGGWVLNRIVDGFKTVTEALGSVGGWLKNRVGDAMTSVKDSFLSIGGNIMGWIVDGLKGGANLLVDFVNTIIDVINKIPGVDLKHIKGFAEGGEHGGKGGPNGTGRLARGGVMGHDGASIAAFAHGGFFAKTGGYMNMPVALGGEETPKHAEWVIPENPAYRSRALGLWQAAGERLGATGFAEGGVVSAFKGAIKETGASQKPSLALFEAGIVESGLRNLTYGDADSLGALQLRESLHGRALAMDPFGSAVAFLTRGFTGRGGAISLSKSDLSAGQVAQAVQGSAFPDRYDQVRDQALEFLGGKKGGGGIGAALTGAIGALLSNGPGAILDKLPGVGDLPDWLKGTGKYVLDAAGDWIKSKVSDVIGLAGGDGAVGGGVSGDIQGAMALARKMGLAITSTTGGQHAQNSWHYKGRAADVAGSGDQMAAFFDAALAKYGKNLLELFYDPRGAIKNGARIPAIGGHGDHVHIALAQGGMFGGAPFVGSYATGGTIPRDGMAYVHKGETVTPATASNDSLIASNDRLSAALERLMQTRHLDAVDALADHMGQRLGNDAVRRGQTAGDPSRTAIVR